jgi:predicted nucleotidyltransferase component of viral defense system
MRNKVSNWVDLLRIAYKIVENANIKDWTFGGGTALSTYYNHRRSKDVDIFLTNVQVITYLSPRLNAFSQRFAKEYSEQSNFLKLYFHYAEIDFIAAPHLTKNCFTLKTVSDDLPEIRVETAEEICIKKLFYRAETLKIRDIFDIAAVIRDDEKKLLNHIEVFKGKTDILSARFALAKSRYYDEVDKLDILDLELKESALHLFENFLRHCGL